MTVLEQIEDRLRTDPHYRAAFARQPAQLLSEEGIVLMPDAQQALVNAVRRANERTRADEVVEPPNGITWNSVD